MSLGCAGGRADFGKTNEKKNVHLKERNGRSRYVHIHVYACTYTNIQWHWFYIWFFIFCMPIWCNESFLKMEVEAYPQNETYVIMTSGNSSLGSSCRSWKPSVALSTSELLEIKEQLETSTTLFWLKNLNLLVSCLCLCVCTWKRTLDPRSTNWNLAKFPLTIRRSLIIFETNFSIDCQTKILCSLFKFSVNRHFLSVSVDCQP